MDLEAKKKLLRWIPCGLYVVGVKSGNEVHAFTGSWFSQASMKPPCIMLGVRTDARSYEMIKQTKVLAVSYIRKENAKTIEHFFKPVKRDENRLGGYSFFTGKTGAPILEEAIGYLDCEVKSIAEGFGDHACVIAEVIDAQLKEDTPPIILSDTPWKYGG